jgi:hypothetical protein
MLSAKSILIDSILIFAKNLQQKSSASTTPDVSSGISVSKKLVNSSGGQLCT